MATHPDWVCGHHLFNGFQISNQRSLPLLACVGYSSLWTQGAIYGVARSSRWGATAQVQAYEIMPNPGGGILTRVGFASSESLIY